MFEFHETFKDTFFNRNTFSGCFWSFLLSWCSLHFIWKWHDCKNFTKLVSSDFFLGFTKLNPKPEKIYRKISVLECCIILIWTDTILSKNIWNNFQNLLFKKLLALSGDQTYIMEVLLTRRHTLVAQNCWVGVWLHHSSPFLDVKRMSMSTVFFVAQLYSGILCL